ncbi:MAG: hypothetical protein AAF127_13505 [Pseudomonadota bacterium]
MKAPGHVNRSPLQRAAIIVAVVVQIGSTFLPQLGYGEPIGNRSDAIRTLITPSGWAFAIWGPLFLGSAVFAIWQALPGQRHNALIDKIAWPAAVALAAQGVWAIYTQFENLTAISVVIIVTSLIGLLMVLRALCQVPALRTSDRWVIGLTFGALAAWLTAASIVNVSAALAYYGVGGGFAYPLAAAAMVATGGIIAALATVRSRGCPWYALVFVWAVVAIYFRGGQQAGSVAAACVFAAVVVTLGAIAGLANPDNRRHWIGI